MSELGGVARGDRVFEVSPTDDVGARTLANFQYQAELATARLIFSLEDDRISSIICEWHEDYVVQYRNGPSELVSVKHRDGSQPHWNVTQLCADGGLKHLYDRFCKVGEACTCRLQTTEMLRTGESHCGGLRDVCNNNLDDGLDRWAALIAKKFNDTDVARVRRFLATLTVEDGLPDRRAIEAVHIQQLGSILERALHITGADCTRAYRVATALVLKASQSPGAAIVLEALADPSALSDHADSRRLLAAKTVDRTRLREEVLATRQGPSVLLSAPSDLAPVRSRMVKKLEAGGIGATGVRSAHRLRANWDRHRSGWSTELPGEEPELEHLRAHVMKLAGRAEAETRRPGKQYGPAMHTVLEDLVAATDLASIASRPVTPELLMGLVYERTEDCEIFWSDEFDPDAVP